MFLYKKNETLKKKIIAVFDFDGTITKVDSFNDFLIWNFGLHRFLLALLYALPLITLYGLKLIKNDKPKEFLFSFFFKGYNIKDFKKICIEYNKKRLSNIIKSEALKKINWHITKGHFVIINSASIKDYISPWASKYKLDDVLATEIEIKNQLITGKFSSPCCYGIEKINQLKNKDYFESFDLSYAYGNSNGDKFLLEWASFSFYKTFK